jgi:hypothetical protein
MLAAISSRDHLVAAFLGFAILRFRHGSFTRILSLKLDEESPFMIPANPPDAKPVTLVQKHGAGSFGARKKPGKFEAERCASTRLSLVTR